MGGFAWVQQEGETDKRICMTLEFQLMLHPANSVVESWEEKPFNKSTNNFGKVGRSEVIQSRFYAFILFKMSFWESAKKSAILLSVQFNYQTFFP